MPRSLAAGHFVFHLTILRQNIASYPDMAVETASRLFAMFQSENIIDVDHRHVTTLDVKRLKTIVGECE